MHEPVRGGVDRERLAKGERRLDARANQRLVGRLLAVRQHADGDLRAIAEERLAERAPARTADEHPIAGRRAHVGHVGAVDPRMTAAKTLFAARGENDGRNHPET